MFWQVLMFNNQDIVTFSKFWRICMLVCSSLDDIESSSNIFLHSEFAPIRREAAMCTRS